MNIFNLLQQLNGHLCFTYSEYGEIWKEVSHGTGDVFLM